MELALKDFFFLHLEHSQILRKLSVAVGYSAVPGISILLLYGGIASRKQFVHQSHLDPHGCAVVKALRLLIELETCVVQEIGMLRECCCRHARLDNEALFEGHAILVNVDTELNEI